MNLQSVSNSRQQMLFKPICPESAHIHIIFEESPMYAKKSKSDLRNREHSEPRRSKQNDLIGQNELRSVKNTFSESPELACIRHVENGVTM
ncbi:hypothetical protein AC249_AIPGENE28744 [Exaiptasia diaphana]|nr:hypothetical protein AC249_AIPGENE28744 [Exaiptasia diaphana]